MTVPSPAAAEQTIHYDAAAGKLVKTSAKDAKNGPVPAIGSFSFAGIEDKYFTAVFLPGNNTTTEIQTFDDKAPTPYNPSQEQLVGVAVGGEGVNRFSLFVGPKDLEILKKVNPKLELVGSPQDLAAVIQAGPHSAQVSPDGKRIEVLAGGAHTSSVPLALDEANRVAVGCRLSARRDADERDQRD